MSTYLLKIKPLEPYTFGTDQRFNYKNEERKTGKESSYVNSNEVPEQTTILGMLRFWILEHDENFKVNSDFQYTPDQKKAMKELIGPKSFMFSEKKGQDFGKIKKISPVFLIKENEKEDDYYIKNPAHHLYIKEKEKEEKSDFLKMNTKINTSCGTIALPDNYDTKAGICREYTNVKDGTKAQGLFKHTYIVGNQKQDEKKDNIESFFKREIIQLDSKFSFAVFLTLEDDYKFPNQSIGYMGLKRTAFSIKAEKKEDDLIKKIKDGFAVKNNEQKDSKWFYALSDLYIEEDFNINPKEYNSFCIVTQKQMRNLKTNQEKGSVEIRKSKVNLIESGSVFFEHHNLKLNNENCKKIGYNILVELGGN